MAGGAAESSEDRDVKIMPLLKEASKKRLRALLLCKAFAKEPDS